MPTMTASIPATTSRARKPALTCALPDLDGCNNPDELFRFAMTLRSVADYSLHRAEVLRDPTSAAAGWSTGRLGQIRAHLPRRARW